MRISRHHLFTIIILILTLPNKNDMATTEYGKIITYTTDILYYFMPFCVSFLIISYPEYHLITFSPARQRGHAPAPRQPREHRYTYDVIDDDAFERFTFNREKIANISADISPTWQ